MPRHTRYETLRDASITGAAGGWALGNIARMLMEAPAAIVVGGAVLIIGGTMLYLMLGPIGVIGFALAVGYCIWAGKTSEREERERTRLGQARDAAQAAEAAREEDSAPRVDLPPPGSV